VVTWRKSNAWDRNRKGHLAFAKGEILAIWVGVEEHVIRLSYTLRDVKEDDWLLSLSINNACTWKRFEADWCLISALDVQLILDWDWDCKSRSWFSKNISVEAKRKVGCLRIKHSLHNCSTIASFRRRNRTYAPLEVIVLSCELRPC